MEGIGRECFDSEAEFFRVMDGLPIMIRTCSADGKIVFCNTAWKKFTIGWGPGFKWSDGMKRDILDGWKHVYDSNVSLKKGFKAKYLSKGAGGKFIWLAEQLVPSFSATGEVLGFACYAQEIDELVVAGAQPLVSLKI